MCLRGASAVAGLLEQHPRAFVRVFAVWMPVLATDVVAPTSRTLGRLADPRVRQYWDPDSLVAKKLGQDARPPQPEPDCCRRKGVLWDLLAIYPSGGEWTATFPTAVVFNGPVEDVADALKQALVGSSTEATR